MSEQTHAGTDAFGDLQDLEATEVDDVDESDEVASTSAPISYFGIEFDIHGLVRRYNERSIVVPTLDPTVELPDPNATGFQRGRVWRRPQQDRLSSRSSLAIQYLGSSSSNSPARGTSF